MSEIGSGSGSSYPGTLDTNTTQEVNSPNAGATKARAEVPNDLAACIVAIETELGTDPAGTLADVKTFLQTQHATNGTHAGVTTNTLSASGQITSTLATGTAPFVVASTTQVANLNVATAGSAAKLTAATQSVVTGSRAVNTDYQNTSGYPMIITVSVKSSSPGDSWTAKTDTNTTPTTAVAQFINPNNNEDCVITFVVKPSNYYRLTHSGAGTPTVSLWTEWTLGG